MKSKLSVSTPKKTLYLLPPSLSWWKQHLNVYHVIAGSAHGLMAQMLGGLITYLLLAIYCHEEHKERVSISRVRELRIKIRNELFEMLTDAKEQQKSLNSS